MRRLSLFICTVILAFLTTGAGVLQAQAKDAPDIQTRQLVGKIVSVNPEELSFDMDYEQDELTHDRKTSTFFVTDVTTIDIAMAQGTLSDLTPGLNVLIEYAPMPDGSRVVESIWVKKT